MPKRMERRKTVSAAKKATMLDEVKFRDFKMDSVIEEEFARTTGS